MRDGRDGKDGVDGHDGTNGIDGLNGRNGLNGTNGTFRIFGWIGGSIAFLITIYTVFHVPLANGLAEERDCRQREDSSIRQEVTRRLDTIKEQNSQISIALAELKTELKYIRKENGRVQ